MASKKRRKKAEWRWRGESSISMNTEAYILTVRESYNDGYIFNAKPKSPSNKAAFEFKFNRQQAPTIHDAAAKGIELLMEKLRQLTADLPLLERLCIDSRMGILR